MKPINIKGNRVYHKEIIHKDELIKLYEIEEPITKFSLKVTTDSDRAFTTLLSKQRKVFGLKEKDLILLRAIKGNREVSFISKIYISFFVSLIRKRKGAP